MNTGKQRRSNITKTREAADPGTAKPHQRLSALERPTPTGDTHRRCHSLSGFQTPYLLSRYSFEGFW
jgi:hypothetical protein